MTHTPKTFFSLLLIMLAGHAAHTARANTNSGWDLRIYALAEEFTWEEFFDGQRLVREEGPRFGLGADALVPVDPRLNLLGRGEIFLGQVDYDGGVQEADGSVTPINSETTYSGVRLEAALGIPMPIGERTTLMPIGGFGCQGWLRTLDTELGDRYIGQYGYEELWFTVYGMLGARVTYAIDSKHSCFAGGSANLPFWNREYADLSNVSGPDSVDLEPGKRTGWSASAGFTARPFTADLYFEGMDFGESDVVDEGFFQPKSTLRSIGLRAGVIF